MRVEGGKWGVDAEVEIDGRIGRECRMLDCL
jgi:hypothetical protein